MLTLLAALVAPAEGQWRLQFYHDEDKSSMAFHDLSFPSSRRGVALGMLSEANKATPIALVTGNGGEKWETVRIKETGVSLFFLDDSTGWMVSDRGIWQTKESGRSWTKIASLRGVLRVFFLDAQSGFAVGMRKSVWMTADGGKSWKPLPAAAAPKSTADYTAYHTVEFAGPLGIIAGASRPPRRSDSRRLPDWMDPEQAGRRREQPALIITLETRDGGRNWTPSVNSLFGRVSRLRLRPEGHGMVLFEYVDSFAIPSEVVRMDLRSGKSRTVFRSKDRAITDILPLAGGSAYIAGSEVSGSMRSVPIPGKVKILRTKNFLADGEVAWEELEVDYRAVARRVMLATSPEGAVWAATDSGMILKLETAPKR